MSNQILISSGAKLRDLDDVIIGTDGVLSSLGFNVANGVPKLDENGKILVSQLPNSVMEFKGVWNAATNTPTLADGVGNAGDVYLCNVAGTVNFGTGPIAFAVGDYAVYTGTVWARSSGATGTVTSVAVSKDGDALAITGSPITTSGTINIGFTGTNLQYINGAGNLVTFPILTGFVPYTGATQNVDLGTYGLLGDFLQLNTSPTSVPTAVGTVSWDNFYRTMQIVTGDGDTTLQVGQEQVTLIHNNTGSTLTDGQVVYVTGSTGELPTVALASNTTEATSSVTFGVVTESIANGADGFITTSGMVHGLNTLAFNEGDALYLGATAGTFTNVKPSAPNNLVLVGYMIKKAGGNGSIFVKIQNGYELEELHDVLITSVADGDILQYNSATSLWENVAGSTTNIAEGSNLYFTDARARAAISLTTTGSTGPATYNSTTGVLNIPNYVDQYVGTVTSVGLSAPTGFSVSGSPVTSSGTLALSFASGYSLPTNVKQSNWDDAYTWVAAFPTQTGNAGKFLTTDGSTLSWAPNPLGTVTSVDMSVPTGLSVSGNPITTSGTLAVTFTAGYSIPTNASQANWDTAYTNRITSLTTTGSSGSATLVSNTLNIPTYTLAGLGGVPTTRTLTINGVAQDLSADRTWTITAGISSVSGTSPISVSTVSGAATVSIATANTTTTGALTSTDWNTFNNKQNALTNPITGTGTAPKVARFSGTGTIVDSYITDALGTATVINKDGLNNFSAILSIYPATGTNASILNLDNSGAGSFYIGRSNSAGGSPLTTASAYDTVIGHTGNQNLHLITNSTSRLAVFGNGNIGVNTGTDAGYKLDVNGSGRFVTNLSINGNLYTNNRANIGGAGDDIDITLNVNAPAGAGKFIMFGRDSSSTAVYSLSSAGIITSKGHSISSGNATQLNIAGSEAWTNASIAEMRGHNAIGITQFRLGTTNGMYFGITSNNTPAIQNADSSNNAIDLSLNPFGGNVGIALTGTNLPARLNIAINGSNTVAGAFTSSGINLLDPTTVGVYSQITFGYVPSRTYAAAYMGYLSTNSTSGGFGDLVFGTRNSADIQPTERLRILSSGPVLVNTPSGVSGGGALQVNGDVNINGNFKINGTIIGGGGGSGVTGSGTSGYITKWTGSSTLANSIIRDDGSSVTIIAGVEIITRFAASGDGTIIIGGTAAQGVSSGEMYVTYQNGTTNTNAWMVGMDDGEDFRWAYGAQGEITDANSLMKMSQSGYLGLGTLTPLEKLHVQDGNVSIRIQSTTAGQNANLKFVTTARTWSLGPNQYLGDSSFEFVDTTAGASRMTIFTSGNLSLNSGSSPSDNGYKLQINGSASFAYGFLSVYRGSSSPNDILVGNDGSRFYIGGNTYVAGSVTATGGFFDTSDARLKTLVEDNYLLSSIANVKAKLYTKGGRKELGYYAQDLLEILPSAVSEGADGFLSLSYAQVHTAKIAVIEDEVTMLKNRVSELEKQLNLN